MPTLRLDSFIRDHYRVPVLARCRKSRLGGAAPTPNPNRLNCPRRKWTTVSPSAAPPGRLRLNHSQALAQNPAESRELPRRFALGSTSLWKRRLDGGASRIRTLSTPRRIESESEPPNLATEKNTGCGAIRARNPQSPVSCSIGHATTSISCR